MTTCRPLPLLGLSLRDSPAACYLASAALRNHRTRRHGPFTLTSFMTLNPTPRASAARFPLPVGRNPLALERRWPQLLSGTENPVGLFLSQAGALRGTSLVLEWSRPPLNGANTAHNPIVSSSTSCTLVFPSASLALFYVSVKVTAISIWSLKISSTEEICPLLLIQSQTRP